ncbi:MAG: mechanosensitive ion channel family protein [Phycisphaerales bacterium]
MPQPSPVTSTNEIVGDLSADTQQAMNSLVRFALDYGPNILAVLAILTVAWFLSNWARRAVRNGLQRANFDLTLSKFFGNVIRWAILALAIITCLGRFGIQTATFAAMLGAVGLAIGLALQGTLSHMAAGVMLLVFRPFKVGDGISAAGQSGVVNEIDLFTTTLDTADGRRIIVPNGAIFGNVIENATYHPRRRIDLPVAASPAVDPDTICSVLLEAATSVPGILADPAPEVVQNDLAGSWTIMAWVPTPNFATLRQGLLRAARQAMIQQGIAAPRPVMDVAITAMPRA